MSQQYDNLSAALRELANRWALKARDYARESKDKQSSDPQSAAYNRGIAETYYKLATELAEMIKQGGSASASAAPAAVSTSAADAPPAPTPSQYLKLSVGEVLRILEYGGVTPRDVREHSDNAFTAIFSRWQPMDITERLALIRAADLRIVILAQGKMPDTGDPYVDFAFRELPGS